MYYNFKCESCNKVHEVEIPISDYDKEKEKQVCPICKCKMKRVLEWQGIAMGGGDGWCGKKGGTTI